MHTGTGKRGAYKAAEVCEIAHIQPYVLRSWESEFPRLGVVRGGSRLYRQADVEQVLRIKQLVFEEGLTLAGARRRIEDESQPQPELPLEEFVTPEFRERIARVKDGLQELLGLLGHERAASGLIGRAEGAERRAAAGDDKSAAAATPVPAGPKAPVKKRAAGAREKARRARPSRRHGGRA